MNPFPKLCCRSNSCLLLQCISAIFNKLFDWSFSLNQSQVICCTYNQGYSYLRIQPMGLTTEFSATSKIDSNNWFCRHYPSKCHFSNNTVALNQARRTPTQRSPVARKAFRPSRCRRFSVENIQCSGGTVLTVCLPARHCRSIFQYHLPREFNAIHRISSAYVGHPTVAWFQCGWDSCRVHIPTDNTLPALVSAHSYTSFFFGVWIYFCGELSA